MFDKLRPFHCDCCNKILHTRRNMTLSYNISVCSYSIMNLVTIWIHSTRQTENKQCQRNIEDTLTLTSKTVYQNEPATNEHCLLCADEAQLHCRTPLSFKRSYSRRWSLYLSVFPFLHQLNLGNTFRTLDHLALPFNSSAVSLDILSSFLSYTRAKKQARSILM